jgi:hypothetical protein
MLMSLSDTYIGIRVDILLLESPEGFLAQDCYDGVHGGVLIFP